ncbi:hypothetical protein DRP53_03875 [candidate division WOR-3 bacterium]|uniref:Periplasmic heavy metal sensor n=1 Tax=candidate division WOR-3 bacterium TaxID=2052148 RepID=A0A660SLD4_UNCW3|nr:MAG: hypothetical protein DRP53_03875 [candidate division WOR-3 bacterium]
MIIFLLPILFGQIEEEHLRTITSIKIAELTQLLELDDEQIAKIIPMVRELERLRFDFHRKKRRMIEELRIILKTEPDEKLLREKLSQLKKMRIEFIKKEGELKDRIEQLLSLEQRVKFVIFQDEFEQRLRRLIRRIREPGRIFHPGP